jgi:DNA polymerase-3 subunit epsilon
VSVRQIILDTETTGLDWRKGNRVVEIGCVELIKRRPSGNNFHFYLKPDCDFEEGAQEVTGLTLEFLADKPVFTDIVEQFLAYVDGAELIIHNASFDMGFLENELALAGSQYGKLAPRVTVTDTLLMARKKFPGQRNSLDALCRRLGVENGHRQLHGALLDAQILADVYIALTSGQEEIGFGEPVDAAASAVQLAALDPSSLPPRPLVRVNEDELAAHQARLGALRKKAGRAIWDGPSAETEQPAAG